MSRLAHWVVRAILPSVVIILTPPVGYGQNLDEIDVELAQAVGWPYEGTMPPYGGWWYSPCYPFATCFAYQQFQSQERRRERFEALRREQPASGKAALGVSASTLDRAHAPNQTDDAQVQPGYRGSGQIRDQYRGSGNVLPDFRDNATH